MDATLTQRTHILAKSRYRISTSAFSDVAIGDTTSLDAQRNQQAAGHDHGGERDEEDGRCGGRPASVRAGKLAAVMREGVSRYNILQR